MSKPMGQEGRRYFILCNECGAKLTVGEDVVFLLALFGPQGLDSEDAVLLCVPWEDRAPRMRERSVPFICDGGCGRMVAVAPSSGWFIERHRRERAG